MVQKFLWEKAHGILMPQIFSALVWGPIIRYGKNMYIRHKLFSMMLAFGLCGFAPNGHAQTPLYFDPELRLTAPPLSGLPRLRFLTSLDFPPFNFADSNKKPTGMNVELARAICEELKISAKCEIQAMPWEELEPALIAQRGEAIIAGTQITADKRAVFNLSHTYFRFPARFIAKRDWSAVGEADFGLSIEGQAVAVVEGTAHEAMLKAYFPRTKMIALADAQSVYSAVRSGEAQLGFVDGVASSFWLTSKRAANCCAFIGGAYYSEKFLGLGMAVVTRKENAELSQAIDAALKAIEESGKYTEIFQIYFPNSPHGPNF